MSTHRTSRLAEEIRDEVARIITSDLKDPRIGFVTVTRVDLTQDLHHVRIFVGVLGDKAQKDKTLLALQQAAGFVRRGIGKRVRMRITPQVSFAYDVGLDATARVAELLEEARTSATAMDPNAPPAGAALAAADAPAPHDGEPDKE